MNSSFEECVINKGFVVVSLGKIGADLRKAKKYLEDPSNGYTQISPTEYCFGIPKNIIDGDGIYVDGFSYKNNSKSNDLDELYEQCGEFCAVSFIKGESSFKFVNDYFGLGAIYAYETEEVVIVSNYLELIMKTVSSVSSFVYDELHFKLLNDISVQIIQQPLLDTFPIKGLRKLPLGNIYSVSKGIITSTPCGITFASKYAEQYSYDELIELSVKDVRENIRVIYERHCKNGNIFVDLSGGKDSRMVLAACLGIVNLRDKLRINSKDVPGSQDLDIACKIVKDQNLRFVSDYNGKLNRISQKDAIKDWINYYYTEYSRLGIPTYSCKGSPSDFEVYLTGGCGEAVTRTANVGWLRKLASSELESFGELVIKGIKFYSRSNNSDLDLKLRELIKKKYEEYAGLSVNDCLNRFYLETRNRVHFGLSALAVYHGKRNFFPLMSKYLYAASFKLSDSERQSGKIIYDFILKSFPKLLDYPFSSRFDYWEQRNPNLSVHDYVKAEQDSISEMRSEWVNSNNLYSGKRASSIVRLSNTHGDEPNFDLNSYVYACADEALIKIRDFDIFGTVDVTKLRNTIQYTYGKNQNHGMQLAVYVTSFANFLKFREQSLKQSELSVPKSFNPVLENAVNGVHTQRLGKELCVTALLPDSLSNYESIAAYLLKNGTVVERKWYSKSTKVTFKEDIESTANYSVKFFVRIDGAIYTQMVPLEISTNKP